MVLPVDLIIIRHGQSEANIVQQQMKDEENYEPPEWFRNKHDSKMNLSPLGREQAIATGVWLRENGFTDFDDYFVSPHTRACQTAGLLGIDGLWQKDDRWRERDWGVYGMVTKAERKARYGDSTEIRSRSEWYWKPSGGESLATGVRLRFDSILSKIHRETNKDDDNSAVIAVAHGEMIRVAQFVLERMTPDDWNRQEEDEMAKMSNCQILHYTRRNPVTGVVGRKAEWRRAICAWDETRSWNNGEWTHLSNRLFTDEELLGS